MATTTTSVPDSNLPNDSKAAPAANNPLTIATTNQILS
jgi:hypothetical protein